MDGDWGRGSYGLSARRAWRTKSSRPEEPKAGPKGRQLEVGPRRGPRLLVNYNHKWWSRLWDFEIFIERPHQRYTLIHIFLGKLGPGQLCYAQFLVMILMTLVIMITMIVIGRSSVHAQSFDDHDPWKPVLQHNKVSTFNVKWRKMCWKFGWNPFSVGQDIKISLGINFAWHFYWNI